MEPEIMYNGISSPFVNVCADLDRTKAEAKIKPSADTDNNVSKSEMLNKSGFAIPS
jgi:hypothetical protein